MPSARPNIVIVTTHDTGAHFGCYGVPSVHTPHIDALADDGLRFTRMFATASICTPSRGSLLTGRYPESNGLMGLAGNGYRYELDHPREHLSHILREEGYYCALFGHQHETADPYKALGFDHYACDPMRHESTWVRRDVYDRQRLGMDDAVTVAKRAAAFVRQRADFHLPLYLQIGFFETHTPYLWGDCEPDSSRGLWLPPYTGYEAPDEELAAHLAGLQGSIRCVDHAVDIITRALQEAGLEDNTLFVFTVDHGPELPRAKWTALDAGSRVAFILRWPAGGLHGGQTHDLLLNNVDFLPTLLNLLDLPLPGNVEGVDFASALVGEAGQGADPRREAFFSFFYGGNYAVRTEQHKLIRNFYGNAHNYGGFRQGADVPLVELYDLQQDPLEQNNVADDQAYADVRAELEDRLWRHLERVGAPVLQGPVAYPPYRLAMARYDALRGRWGNSGRELSRQEIDGSVYTAATDRYCLRRDLAAIYMPRALQLYDLRDDPDCTLNVAYDPAYRDALCEMDARFWSWLEMEDAPILYRPYLAPERQLALSENLTAYYRWRAGA